MMRIPVSQKYVLRAFLHFLGLSLFVLGITIVWPRLPGNYNPATMIDGKGPYMANGYLCASRHGAYPCSAGVFWPTVIMMSPLGIIVAAQELRDAPLRSLFVIALIYLILIMLKNRKQNKQANAKSE